MLLTLFWNFELEFGRKVVGHFRNSCLYLQALVICYPFNVPISDQSIYLEHGSKGIWFETIADLLFVRSYLIFNRERELISILPRITWN